MKDCRQGLGSGTLAVTPDAGMTRRTLLLAAGFLLIAAGSSPAAVITVDDDGPADFATISAAVAAASDGDSIVVADGTYIEQVIVDKVVSITGVGAGLTVVLPSVSAPGVGTGSQVTSTTWLFRVQRDNVSISGLTVDGNNPALSAGIDARGGIITDFTTGTYNNLSVTNCEVKNVKYRGIYAAAGGSGHTLNSNTVRNVKSVMLESVGIFFFGAAGEARDNLLDDCSVGLGFQAGGGGTIEGNTISRCDLGILSNGSTVPVTIENNNISDSAQGIQSIAANTSVDVLSNTLTGCLTGLVFFGLGPGGNTADGNTIDCQGVLLSSAVFVSTDVSPVGFGDVNVTLTNNNFKNADFGVALTEDPAGNAPLLTCLLSGDAQTYNVFSGNLTFNLLQQDCNDNVDATHNVWGVVTPALIETSVWHQIDDPLLGLVDFSNQVNLFITVDDDGPADFASINPAVQALLPGGTIEVRPGLYLEDVVIDRSCTIQGSGTDSDPLVGTVLRGASVDAFLIVVSVTASDVLIDNLRVDGQQPVHIRARHCVFAANVTGLNVTNCVLHTARSVIQYESGTGGLFLNNELFDFGLNANVGAGIFLLGSQATVGAFGSGNDFHDGVATGVIFSGGSSGSCVGNRASRCGIGYLSVTAGGLTVFDRNEASDCDQGFQNLANAAPVSVTENAVFDCVIGFAQFGGGTNLHTYTGNYARERTLLLNSNGFFFTTSTVLGNAHVNAVCHGNVISGSTNGIQLFESAASALFIMNVKLDGTAVAANANWITGSTSQAILLLGCNDNVDASDNYFASTDPLVVEGLITHQVDNPTLGLVDFSGLLAPSPDLRRRGQIVDLRHLSLISTGDPGDAILLIWGLTPANVNTSFGTLLISPFFVVAAYTTNATGLGVLEFVLPVRTPHPNLTHYFQALVGNSPSRFLTNRAQGTTPP